MRTAALAALLAIFLGGSCGNPPGEDALSDAAASQDSKASSPSVPATLAAALEAVPLTDPVEDGYPSHEIRLSVNGRSFVIDTVAVCPDLLPTDRAEHRIPANVLAACGGWYAGAGDYFYLLQRNDSLLLYQGWLDEMQQDDSYHYEIVWSTILQ
ncbi:MAG: hypothetical protein KDC54_01265 [Lewinella sp.]|nr:hypothetical protein [Lewinella sp.]